jgi:hypothetical protein
VEVVVSNMVLPFDRVGCDLPTAARGATYGRAVNYVGGVSKARAKKKRRQRARAAGEPASAAAKGPRAAGGAAEAARDAKAAPTATPSRSQAAAARLAARGSKAPRGGGVPAPKPIWAPFPLTEIGMAAGIIIFGSGFESSSSRTLSIGALVLAVVTGELCLREHFAGFRSHTLLLAALAVATAHATVVLAITDAYRGPLTLVVDLAIGGALAWWLRTRYRVAHERALSP